MPTLNISSKGHDMVEVVLSNLYPADFTLGDLRFKSVEGFIQGIKFPPQDRRRFTTFQLFGLAAKGMGKVAVLHYKTSWVYWKGKRIPYGSDEHHKLIEKAIRAKFVQNPQLADYLVKTEGFELTHDTGHPESPHTSLPAELFIKMLVKIRKELKAAKAQGTT